MVNNSCKPFSLSWTWSKGFSCTCTHYKNSKTPIEKRQSFVWLIKILYISILKFNLLWDILYWLYWDISYLNSVGRFYERYVRLKPLPCGWPYCFAGFYWTGSGWVPSYWHGGTYWFLLPSIKSGIPTGTWEMQMQMEMRIWTRSSFGQFPSSGLYW